jgi:hypothetical protein
MPPLRTTSATASPSASIICGHLAVHTWLGLTDCWRGMPSSANDRGVNVPYVSTASNLAPHDKCMRGWNLKSFAEYQTFKAATGDTVVLIQ